MIVHMIILYLVVGSLVGVLAGLLGIGGGILIVPFLVWQLPEVGVHNDMLMHVAVATSLALAACSAAVSGWRHHSYGNVRWAVLGKMLGGLILGAFLGTLIAKHVQSDALQLLFGIFVWFVSYQMEFPRKVKEDHRLPSGMLLNIVSTMMGCLCILLGVSGGSLLVPYFTRCGFPLRSAIATSSVCTFPVAMTGVIMLMFFVTQSIEMPAHSLGYVYFPAFLGLILPCLILVPVGVRLSMHLEAAIIRRIFAVILFMIGIDMVYQSVQALWFSGG